MLAFFNITGWNGLVLFGVQQLPAGRSAILAYTMPVWATLVALVVLHEPMNRRKTIGLVLGMIGMALLIGEDFRLIERKPFGAAMIVGAAIMWSFGTVLLRKWKPPIAQNTLSGWMMLAGWLPLVVAAPFFDDVGLPRLANVSWLVWFALLYNVFLAGTLAHWAWFTLARTLPVAVSGLASLPVPVVGVFAGMIVLGERPGHARVARARLRARVARARCCGRKARRGPRRRPIRRPTERRDGARPDGRWRRIQGTRTRLPGCFRHRGRDIPADAHHRPRSTASRSACTSPITRRRTSTRSTATTRRRSTSGP